MSIVLGLLAAYYAVTLLSYALPLLAYRYKRLVPSPPPGQPTGWTGAGEGSDVPLLVIVAPSRRSPGSVRGMAEACTAQNYPKDRYRTIILIDTDSEDDPSARLAHDAGAEVYERYNPPVRTKGAAINELLDRRLRNETFDALIILDIDARMDASFLSRVAAHLSNGARVIQTAPIGKNVQDSTVTRLSHAAQLISQIIQRGRVRLGLPAILSGTGMVLDRASLDALEWQISTGKHLSDDGELNFRCHERRIPVTYGGDLELRNDLPPDTRAVRLQRRRWNAAYFQLLPAYGWPMIRETLRGHWRALESLFTLIFLPSCSLSFVLGGAAAFALGLWSLITGAHWTWFWIAAALWSLHVVYYIVAFCTVGYRLTWGDLRRLPAFLGMRSLAVFEGVLLASHRDAGHKSIPAAHHEEKGEARNTVLNTK